VAVASRVVATVVAAMAVADTVAVDNRTSVRTVT